MTGNVNSLPKWAQEKIAGLEAKVARLEDERGTRAAEAMVAWSDNYRDWYAIPEGAAVHFRVFGASYEGAGPHRVVVQLTTAGLLSLRCPSGSLAILPRASNTVEVKVTS